MQISCAIGSALIHFKCYFADISSSVVIVTHSSEQHLIIYDFQRARDTAITHTVGSLSRIRSLSNCFHRLAVIKNEKDSRHSDDGGHVLRLSKNFFQDDREQLLTSFIG